MDAIGRRIWVLFLALLSIGIGMVILMYVGIFLEGWKAQAAIWVGIVGSLVGIAAIPVWELGNVRYRKRTLQGDLPERPSAEA